MINAILVDDEQLALDFLENQLAKLGKIEIIGKYSNPLKALEQVNNKDVDVVFLDINMPEINGLELAEKIQNEQSDITVVFVTAHDEYAVTAFELNALDYVVKPIQKDRLQKTIDRIKSRFHPFENESSSQAELYVNLCRHLLIGYDPNDLKTLSWRTTKAEELFLYLLQNKSQLVNKSFLVEMLWPELTPEKSFAQLYTAIYHVRNKLKEYGGHFKINSSMEGYILSTEDVFIDMDRWKSQISALPPVNENSIDDYEKVMRLNYAPYLEEHDYLWVEATRYKQEQLWLKTSLEIAKFYYKENRLDDAKKWYRKITDRHPTEEEAHLFLMVIYDIFENPLLVKQQYNELLNILDEELGVLPSKKVKSWYERWKKQTVHSK